MLLPVTPEWLVLLHMHGFLEDICLMKSASKVTLNLQCAQQAAQQALRSVTHTAQNYIKLLSDLAL